MVSKLKKYGCALLVFASWSSWAQSPSWNVDPSEFEFSMTITAILNREGTVSTNSDDKVAAFIKGACRGITSPSYYTTLEGHKIVFLQVYSNTIIGEPITFKLYDAEEAVWMNAVNSITFQNDAAIGTMAAPYIITSNMDPTDIALSNQEIMEGKKVGTFIGTFSATDPDAGPAGDYTYVLDDSLSDAAFFSVRADSLVAAAVFDHHVKSSYDILVIVNDGKGGRFQKKITIDVTIDPDRFIANNYLSPNGDSKNDLWEIRNIAIYKDYSISIYSDAGERVYNTRDYRNDWGGTYEGKTLPKGVYYFIAESPDGARKITGSISINY